MLTLLVCDDRHAAITNNLNNWRSYKEWADGARINVESYA
jgi:hypothetical protein